MDTPACMRLRKRERERNWNGKRNIYNTSSISDRKTLFQNLFIRCIIDICSIAIAWMRWNCKVACNKRNPVKWLLRRYVHSISKLSKFTFPFCQPSSSICTDQQECWWFFVCRWKKSILTFLWTVDGRTDEVIKVLFPKFKYEMDVAFWEHRLKFRWFF